MTVLELIDKGFSKAEAEALLAQQKPVDTAINAALAKANEEFKTAYDPKDTTQIFALDLGGNGVPSFFEVNKTYTCTLMLGDAANSLNWGASNDGKWKIARARLVIDHEGVRYELPVEGVQMSAVTTLYVASGVVPTTFVKITERDRKPSGKIKVAHLYGKAEASSKDYVSFAKNPDGSANLTKVIGY